LTVWPIAATIRDTVKNESTSTRRFASGRWRGYYEQMRRRYPQDQTMEFADGMVRGEGTDMIGPFRIEGEYRETDGEVRVGWIKTYERGHSVLYVGTFDGTQIHGHWEFGSGYGGGNESFGFSPEHAFLGIERMR